MDSFNKKDSEKPVNSNIRLMRSINIIAISIFVLAILFKTIQYLFFK
jgi:hypothetical protein